MKKSKADSGAQQRKAPPWTFAMIPIRAVTDRRLTKADKLVLMYLCTRTDAYNRCYPSSNRIARDVGMCRTNVFKSIARLESAGYLHVACGGHVVSTYTVLFPVPELVTQQVQGGDAASTPPGDAASTQTKAILSKAKELN